MKEYSIPIYWESYKRYRVEADNLQEACEKATKQFLSESDDTYLDDSFEVDEQILGEDYPDEEFNNKEICRN